MLGLKRGNKGQGAGNYGISLVFPTSVIAIIIPIP